MPRLLAFLVTLLLTTSAFAENITVSAAISLKESLNDIAKQYESDTGEKVTFNYGASGQLMAQIQSGAPVDLFISAAQTQIDTLKKANLLQGDPQIIARNTLVLIVPKNAKNPPATFADLADARFTHIAVGESKSVPAGMYAAQTLAALKLADALKPRLVMAANVRQVLDYVSRGEVDAGIVYATDAHASNDVKIIATAPETSHDPIVYPACQIKDSPHPAVAAKFLAYLAADKAQKILQSHGFLSPQPASIPSP